MHPNTSPMWCNTTVSTATMNNYDGYSWYYWSPKHNFIFWYDRPFTEEILDGNVCYKFDGNIWICPKLPDNDYVSPIPTPMPAGNVRPMISVTSVKMENHPEHVSVMFGQILNNLK